MRTGREAQWVAVVTAVTVAGCATIMNQTKQSVGVASTPAGASVTIDEHPSGSTPVVVRLSRKHQHLVHIELAGYQPYETILTRKVSGWVWGNVLIGGVIGLGIDVTSGGMYKLAPDHVAAVLQKTGHAKMPREDVLCIAVVLTPDSRWERIGQLTRAKRSSVQ